jgi:hypothetical protein
MAFRRGPLVAGTNPAQPGKRDSGNRTENKTNTDCEEGEENS